jgi:hypothetical protein
MRYGWRVQMHLCDGVEVQLSASHRDSFNFSTCPNHVSDLPQ